MRAVEEGVEAVGLQIPLGQRGCWNRVVSDAARYRDDEGKVTERVQVGKTLGDRRRAVAFLLEGCVSVSQDAETSTVDESEVAVSLREPIATGKATWGSLFSCPPSSLTSPTVEYVTSFFCAA